MICVYHVKFTNLDGERRFAVYSTNDKTGEDVIIVASTGFALFCCEMADRAFDEARGEVHQVFYDLDHSATTLVRSKREGVSWK
jgi:hypothetical protein